jgi:glycosyltransferase involved in cell wall biosynthesis
MKKVLMIAYNYPPLAGMGMLRNLKLAKYLPYFGWKPIILTVSASIASHVKSQYWLCDESEGSLPNVNIIRTKCFSVNLLSRHLCRFFSRAKDKNYSKLLHTERVHNPNNKVKDFFTAFYNNWVMFPDNTIDWYPFAVKGALDYIKNNKVDIIFSTSLPVTSHIIANTISKKTGIPWIADFRDLWSDSHYDIKASLRKRIDSQLETKVINRAHALTTVSEPLKQRLLNRHSKFKDKIFVLYNGYDPDDYIPLKIAQLSHFTITFTGRMYDIDFERKGRTPELLFQSLHQLNRKGTIDPTKVKVNIYGEYPNDLYELISKYQLQDSVNCLGAVPFRESFEAQQNATILLLLNWNDSDYKGIVTGKIFEYLGARRPILAIPFFNRSVDTILNKTKAGITITDKGSLKSQLSKWYRQYIDKGYVNYTGITKEIEKFSRKRASNYLSRIFDNVIYNIKS